MSLRSLEFAWKEGVLTRSLGILTRSDRIKLIGVCCLQVLMGFFDLAGVLLVGLLGALAISELESVQGDSRVISAMKSLGLEDLAFDKQIIVLVSSAVILLVGRTAFSIFFTRRILFFLSNRGAQISAELVSRLFSQSILLVQARSTQDTLYSITRGVEIITLQILAPSTMLIADLSMLLVMSIGLFLIDPITSVGTFVVFGFVSVILYKLMNVRANELGLLASKLNIESNEKIVEAIGSYREVVVSNRRGFYTKEIGKLRFAIARTLADLQFMPYVSKYVIETGVLLGALLVGCAQFALQDTGNAAGTLAIFLAAGTRLAPAILRIQQNSIQLRGNSGMAKPTLDLIDELESENRVQESTNRIDFEHIGFNAAIEVENISFSYPNGVKRAIADFSIKITPGSVIAIVGPSGAGKSTLADLILGVLTPDKGSISISGLAPLKAVEKWPGSVAYIPQDVMISASTIRQNVAFGYPSEIVSDEMVNRALTIARLESFVSTLPQGLNSNVGERGVRISGGQRQRLGIARAIFTNPGLLVFDEATSSLDAETEEEVAKAIFSLKGKTTIIMIAHRLSTVRTADVVLYINEGCVIANGTFNEVRMAVPDFDTQARLMGL